MRNTFRGYAFSLCFLGVWLGLAVAIVLGMSNEMFRYRLECRTKQNREWHWAVNSVNGLNQTYKLSDEEASTFDTCTEADDFGCEYLESDDDVIEWRIDRVWI